MTEQSGYIILAVIAAVIGIDLVRRLSLARRLGLWERNMATENTER
jgi:hypothetical protein